MEAYVKLKSVSKSYKMGQVIVPALKEIDLDVFPGEFVVLLGPSGSGKTTLLNMIGGLDTPTAGQIVVGTTEVSRLNVQQLTQYRRTQIGFIFQFFNLLPTLTARENVEFAGELVKRRQEALELLKEVGLGERVNHFPSQLSGGENQRVAVARALATDPPLMLCDEPTGSLDYETGKRILKLLRVLNQTRQKTIIIVTHNAPVGAIADRVLQMHDGRISRIIKNDHPLDPELLEW